GASGCSSCISGLRTPRGRSAVDERVRVFSGEPNARGLRIGIVASRFNDLIVERLIAGAVDALTRHGADPADIHVAWVPGAFETPLALQRLAASKRYDAPVALGCVMRGATPHFAHVAGEVSRGVAAASIAHDLPIGFGVLTVATLEQAFERAGGKAGNKGAEAALAAVE